MVVCRPLFYVFTLDVDVVGNEQLCGGGKVRMGFGVIHHTCAAARCAHSAVLGGVVELHGGVKRAGQRVTDGVHNVA